MQLPRNEPYQFMIQNAMNWTMDYAVGEGGLCDEVEGPKNFFGDEKSPSHPSQVSGGEMYGSSYGRTYGKTWKDSILNILEHS